MTIHVADAATPRPEGDELGNPAGAGAYVRPALVEVADLQAPGGGFKQSGVGRLNGPRALAEFQEIKHLVHSVPERSS